MAYYGTVSGPLWNEKPVAIVGGGPSLVGFDFERLRGMHVLAIKGSIFDIPWADAGFGMDFPRFEEWREAMSGLAMRIYWAVPPEKMQRCPEVTNITYLRRDDGAMISDDPGIIHSGGTSGFGGLQIALLKKATRIMLFGFDYNGNFGVFPDKFRHNDRHYGKRRSQEASNWAMWSSYFGLIQPQLITRGVEVINACETSAINAFPRVSREYGADYMHRWGK